MSLPQSCLFKDVHERSLCQAHSCPAPALYPYKGQLSCLPVTSKLPPIASHFYRGSNESPPGPLGLLHPGPHRTLPNLGTSFFFQRTAPTLLSLKLPLFFSSSLSASHKKTLSNISTRSILALSGFTYWISGRPILL